MKIALIPGQGAGRRSAGARQLGFGCVVLFALPFAAVGFGAGFQAVRELWAGDWRTGGFLSLFAVVLGSVGVGLAVAAVVARREAERVGLVAAQHPDEPWLWREDWASGLLADSGRKGQYALWGVATLWNLIGLPVASGFGAAGDPTMIAARDVAGVEVTIGLQAGSTVYYDLAILRTNGRRANAGSGIRDKREAEWLAGLIRQALEK